MVTVGGGNTGVNPRREVQDMEEVYSVPVKVLVDTIEFGFLKSQNLGHGNDAQ
jgi:hypothetical protein